MTNNTTSPKVLQLLKDFDLTPVESAVLGFLHYVDQLPHGRFFAHVPWEVYGMTESDVWPTGDHAVENFKAVRSLYDRGLIRTMTPEDRADILSDLRERGVEGPVYEFSEVGDVDLTPTGARLLSELQNRLARIRGYGRNDVDFAYGGMIRQRVAYFTRYREFQEGWSLRRDPCARCLVEPYEIGPWRAEWWRRFPCGFRSEWLFAYDHLCSHPGCHQVGFDDGVRVQGEWCSRQSPLSDEQQPLLGFALAERGISGEAWEVLGHFERSTSSVSQRLLRDHSQGVAECATAGWIAPVDRRFREELERELNADSALLPLGHGYQCEEGDWAITPAGIERLAEVSRDLFGPLWEDCIRLEQDLGGTALIYCETQRGIENQLEEWEYDRVRVVSHTIEKIGPWCTNWRKVFPSGYKATVEIDLEEMPLRLVPANPSDRPSVRRFAENYRPPTCARPDC
jgi:hypothetical protein